MTTHLQWEKRGAQVTREFISCLSDKSKLEQDSIGGTRSKGGNSRKENTGGQHTLHTEGAHSQLASMPIPDVLQWVKKFMVS
jgi:hypothetical protein